MIELVFGSEDLLQVRFAISPAEEILGAVRTVADPSRHPFHVPWLRQLPGVAPLRDLDELTALVLGDETPDFLSPPPTTPVADLAEQLGRLRTTAPEVVVAELETALRELPATLRDPDRARVTLAAQMQIAWRRLLAELWPQLSALLQGEILARGRSLAVSGARAVLDGLHPRVRWADGSLCVEDDFQERRELAGEGLLLVPSVFTWPDVQVMLNPPWQTTLIYPAPGVEALWEPPRADPALARAFGRTRGQILSELTEPATTGMLADRHGLAPSTVSVHLSALRDAGLLRASRDGRHTWYQLSPLGYALRHGRRAAPQRLR